MEPLPVIIVSRALYRALQASGLPIPPHIKVCMPMQVEVERRRTGQQFWKQDWKKHRRRGWKKRRASGVAA